MQHVTGDAIYLLRQDYFITDTTAKEKKKLGLKNQDYFGRFHFLAIVANGQFYVDANINAPWKLDANFKSITSEKKYQPFLSSVAFRKLNGTKFNNIDSTIAFDTSRLSPLYPTDDFVLIKAPDSLQGLKLFNFKESRLSDTTCWFWTASIPSATVANNQNILNDTNSIQFESSKGKFISSTKLFINNKFYFNDKTIGGFVFITNASFGKVEFLPQGIIIKRSGKFNFISINDPSINDTLKIKEQESSVRKSELILSEIIKRSEVIEVKKVAEKKKRKNNG